MLLDSDIPTNLNRHTITNVTQSDNNKISFQSKADHSWMRYTDKLYKYSIYKK